MAVPESAKLPRFDPTKGIAWANLPAPSRKLAASPSFWMPSSKTTSSPAANAGVCTKVRRSRSARYVGFNAQPG